MRRLASFLDVDPAALYWHFRNKDAILSAINRAGAEAAEFSIPTHGTWQERCLALCQVLRRELHQRPELALQGSGSLWATPFNARANGLLVELLEDAGLRPPDLIFGSFALLHEVMAISSSESLNRSASRESLGDSVRGVAEWLSPRAREAWQEVCRVEADQGFDRTFEFAIQALIVGIEKKIVSADPLE
jgi:TetR/AcrR family tetracycline transcriptional repressor